MRICKAGDHLSVEGDFIRKQKSTNEGEKVSDKGRRKRGEREEEKFEPCIHFERWGHVAAMGYAA